jgi:hypothetical protein
MDGVGRIGTPQETNGLRRRGNLQKRYELGRDEMAMWRTVSPPYQAIIMLI